MSTCTTSQTIKSWSNEVERNSDREHYMGNPARKIRTVEIKSTQSAWWFLGSENCSYFFTSMLSSLSWLGQTSTGPWPPAEIGKQNFISLQMVHKHAHTHTYHRWGWTKVRAQLRPRRVRWEWRWQKGWKCQITMKWKLLNRNPKGQRKRVEEGENTHQHTWPGAGKPWRAREKKTGGRRKRAKTSKEQRGWKRQNQLTKPKPTWKRARPKPT